MSVKRGKIAHEEAYAQGKMLDNSAWKLPRSITPSDIDLVFDDGLHGRVLFVELSKTIWMWQQATKGQRELYSALVARGCGKMLVALCKHSVPSHRQIDTRNDISSFQVMHFAALLGWATSEVFPGDLWPRFVDEFYQGKHFSFSASEATKCG